MFKNIVSIINNFWSIKIFCFKFHFSKYFSGAEDGNYLNHTATGYCFSWSHNLSNLLLFFFLLIFFSFFFFLSLLLNLSPSLVYSSILRHVLYVSTAYIYLCNIHRWRYSIGFSVPITIRMGAYYFFLGHKFEICLVFFTFL
jgi:hypothetical protein